VTGAVVYLKKMVLIVGVLLLVGSGWGARAEGGVLSGGSVFEGAGNSPAEPGRGLERGELFFKMMVSVVLVVVLGAAAYYLLKRLPGRLGQVSGREVRLVETVNLGSRRAVHLLRVGPRRFLIGSTSEEIVLLADLDERGVEVRGDEGGAG